MEVLRKSISLASLAHPNSLLRTGKVVLRVRHTKCYKKVSDNSKKRIRRHVVNLAKSLRYLKNNRICYDKMIYVELVSIYYPSIARQKILGFRLGPSDRNS